MSRTVKVYQRENTENSRMVVICQFRIFSLKLVARLTRGANMYLLMPNQPPTDWRTSNIDPFCSAVDVKELKYTWILYGTIQWYKSDMT